MIKLTADELKQKLELHRKWLNNNGGERLSGAYDLSRANLSGANLCGANLSRANLGEADLSKADLSRADLSRANLSRANLGEADLSKADLSRADLSRANLGEADLSKADLSRADLGGADLGGARNIFIPIACPTHGRFIAWKKVNNKIIKLQIPDDAKRCSATTNKCRCNKALVLAIENMDGTDSGLTEITNTNYAKCTYTVGEMVYPDSFDDNRFNECSHGIHFFVDRGEAERW